MTRILLSFLCLLICTFSGYRSVSQDFIYTMSGKEIPCEIIDDLGIEIRYETTKKFDIRYFASADDAMSVTWKDRKKSSSWIKTEAHPVRKVFSKGKTLERRIHVSEVFSVVKENKDEQVYYEKDDELGNWMTVDQVRTFIAGERDAREQYKDQVTFWVGYGLSGVAAYLSQGGLVTSFITPVAYTLIQFIWTVKIREHHITKPAHQYNEDYALGYGRVARSKKIMQAMKGSGLGMISGVLLFVAFPMN